MRALRSALILLGGALLVWGGWLLFSRQDVDQLLSVLIWLVAVVVLHDGILTLVSTVRHRRRAALSPRATEADESSS